jgi:hypothetical protein
MLHHASSITLPVLQDKDLDIGILFSEPIFDEKKHKEANLPVDFRSEILRLYSALNVSPLQSRTLTNPKSLCSAKLLQRSISNISSVTKNQRFFT